MSSSFVIVAVNEKAKVGSDVNAWTLLNTTVTVPAVVKSFIKSTMSLLWPGPRVTESLVPGAVSQVKTAAPI